MPFIAFQIVRPARSTYYASSGKPLQNLLWSSCLMQRKPPQSNAPLYRHKR